MSLTLDKKTRIIAYAEKKVFLTVLRSQFKSLAKIEIVITTELNDVYSLAAYPVDIPTVIICSLPLPAATHVNEFLAKITAFKSTKIIFMSKDPIRSTEQYQILPKPCPLNRVISEINQAIAGNT